LGASISHSTSTGTSADWAPFNQTFLATGTTSRLTILSTSADTGASGGIFVDAVDASLVPEPTLIATPMIACSLLRRRARARS
jgi:hypothetical protein